MCVCIYIRSSGVAPSSCCMIRVSLGNILGTNQYIMLEIFSIEKSYICRLPLKMVVTG